MKRVDFFHASPYKRIRFLFRMLYSFGPKHLPMSEYCWAARMLRGWFTKRAILKCGKKVNIDQGARYGLDIILGDYSSIGKDSFVQSGTYIGKHVMIAPDCGIYTMNHGFQRVDIPMREQGLSKPKRVVIEDDVWIGTKTVILPGVHIGKGAIIGAGSVVTKSIPPYAIAAGNPARVKKSRISGKKTIAGQKG